MNRDQSAMLNVYPDSMGGTLSDLVGLLSAGGLDGAFGSLYLLPSLFHSDIDRGFSIIDYDLNEDLAAQEDLDAIKALGIDLKLDFLINHISVRSPQFQDILARGDQSEFRDFFIDWNRFWEGRGVMTEEGYIQPERSLLADMFFRKPGLPLLMVGFPDGRRVPYWNTFYQQVDYDTGEYLGQMDLNTKSPQVWDYYGATLQKLAGHGARIVRLDAFAYASKEVGKRNFLNEPETWEILDRVRSLADENQVLLLPEIHATYEEGTHRLLSQKGYMIYDFFLPGLILDAFKRGTGLVLRRWIEEIQAHGMMTVNMLGSHDGIPLLDLKGLLGDEQIQALIDVVVSRGGYVKNLHGKKNMYYQVNATYYSALGEDDSRLLMARAIQLFMPGKPQVWYLDLFAGKNDIAAMERAGEGGHKEINRTNLTVPQIQEGLKRRVVREQLRLLRFRNGFEAFGHGARLTVEDSAADTLILRWDKDGSTARLAADMKACRFAIEARTDKGETAFAMSTV